MSKKQTSVWTYFIIGACITAFGFVWSIIGLVLAEGIDILASAEFRGKVVLFTFIFIGMIIFVIMYNGWVAKKSVDIGMKLRSGKTGYGSYLGIGLLMMTFAIISSTLIAWTFGWRDVAFEHWEFRGKIVATALVMTVVIILVTIFQGWSAKKSVDMVIK
jgi:hypothetical protein